MSNYLPKIQTTFYEAFGTAKDIISEASVPSDIEGWDSLGHAQLVSQLEVIFETQWLGKGLCEGDVVV